MIAICTVLHSIGKHSSINTDPSSLNYLFSTMARSHRMCFTWAADRLFLSLHYHIPLTIGLLSSLTAAILLCLTGMLSLDDGSLCSHLHYFVTTGMVWPEWPESPDCSISTSLPRPRPGNSEQVEMMIGSRRKSCAHSILYFLFLI